MDNNEKYVKDEYVVAFAEYFSCGTHRYVYNEEDAKMPSSLPYRFMYGCGTRYASEKEATGKLNELISKRFFKTDNIVNAENLQYGIVKAWFRNDFGKKKAVTVLKVPSSYYIGKYAAYAYEIGKLGINYDNRHRYQCASHRQAADGHTKWLYAKVTDENSVEWVERQDEATCMTITEQERWCKALNNEKPFKGHVQPMNLPVRLEAAQKFHKGDKVVVFHNGSYRYSTVTDVMAMMDGKYHYALANSLPFGALLCITEEGFYEGPDLYAEDLLLPFNEGVVLPDGSKAASIAPL